MKQHNKASKTSINHINIEASVISKDEAPYGDNASSNQQSAVEIRRDTIPLAGLIGNSGLGSSFKLPL